MADNKKENEDAGFFAIIPANVRYDKSVPQGAKLLYGEITALAKKKGYCWARNEYFAELYETSERTIIEWIGRLRDAGHISIYLQYYPNSRKISRRYISLPYRQDQKLPPEIESSHLVVKKSSPPEEGLVVKKTSPLEDLVVKKSSPPSGEENSLMISTNSNNTKAAAADQSSQNNEKPPPENAATAFSDVSKEAVDKLKFHLAGFDKNILFDASFYPKILSFLSDHNLTFEYITWMYNLCFQKNPKNLCGYLFRILLEPRYVELYREAAREIPEKTFDCPVCGRVLSSQVLSCPECGFDNTVNHDRESIREARLLYSMPSDVKKAYEEELNELSTASPSSMGIFEFGRKVRDLKQKYGLLQAD